MSINMPKMCSNIYFSLNLPHWADSVIESPCSSGCLSVCPFAPHSPLNVEDSKLWIAYMDTQLLGLQSNENLAVWMSQLSTNWRECSIKTLSTIHWVPVQDKGSKILCGKLGAKKITPSDCLHQEYLTINLGSANDWWH